MNKYIFLLDETVIGIQDVELEVSSSNIRCITVDYNVEVELGYVYFNGNFYKNDYNEYLKHKELEEMKKNKTLISLVNNYITSI